VGAYAGAVAVVAIRPYLRWCRRLLERLQIRDDVGDLLVVEARLWDERLGDVVVLAGAECRHDYPRLHAPRVLDPQRQVLGVVGVDTAGDRGARRKVREVRTDHTHHHRVAIDAVTTEAAAGTLRQHVAATLCVTLERLVERE